MGRRPKGRAREESVRVAPSEADEPQSTFADAATTQFPSKRRPRSPLGRDQSSTRCETRGRGELAGAAEETPQASASEFEEVPERFRADTPSTPSPPPPVPRRLLVRILSPPPRPSPRADEHGKIVRGARAVARRARGEIRSDDGAAAARRTTPPPPRRGGIPRHIFPPVFRTRRYTLRTTARSSSTTARRRRRRRCPDARPRPT